MRHLDFDQARDTEYSTFECPVCRESVTADGICACEESRLDFDFEYDHNDQYDTDSALESAYGPSDEHYYSYED